MQKKDRTETLDIFARNKAAGRKTAVLTAYDLTSALLGARGGVDALLVGDSLGMVVLGYENTLPVTMADVLHHCRAVTRARPGIPVIADMPYGSFHLSVEQTVANGLQLVKDETYTALIIHPAAKNTAEMYELARLLNLHVNWYSPDPEVIEVELAKEGLIQPTFRDV